jgi:hypothetical protein
MAKQVYKGWSRGKTMYSAFKRYDAKVSRSAGNTLIGAGAAFGILGGGVPSLIAAGYLTVAGLGMRRNARVAESRGRAIGNFIQHAQKARLGIAQEGAKRSSVVLRASRTLNRTGSNRNPGDGRVKGYYRQQSGKSVYVNDYNRHP